MSTRFEVRPFTREMTDAAAVLLADRHRRHRQACPALNPAYEDAAQCATLIADALAREGSHGAIALADGKAQGYVLMTQRDETWGANAWAEGRGNAGDPEAVRECYAAIAGDLVDEGRKGHWAMVPSSDAGLIEAWFSLSFGRQQNYAFRAPLGTDFQPSAPPGIKVRRAVETDLATLAQLDMVLPNHVHKSPVFSTLKIPNIEEVEAELAEDINNPKYTIWVAEHDERVISTLVGVNVDVSSSWGPMMKPVSAALLGYAATLPEGRGLGAGRALTEAFFEWARDERYEWLVTDWRSTNLEANRTWRGMGFVPMFDRLNRIIP